MLSAPIHRVLIVLVGGTLVGWLTFVLHGSDGPLARSRSPHLVRDAPRRPAVDRHSIRLDRRLDSRHHPGEPPEPRLV